MITLARHSLIVLGILAAPFFGLWIFCGWMADRRGQRACAVMKGPL